MGSPENSVPHQDPPHEAQAPSLVAHAPPPSEPLPEESLWARIRRHKVVEWTLAYAAFGYATLHLVEMLRDAFEWPALVPRLTVFGLVLGTPVAVTLAWYHGHRAQHRVSGRELSILIASLLVAGSVLWLASRHERAAVPRVAVRATSAAGTTAPEATFSPPPHSIAVLPFINISGDKEQEYFSDGLSEELLNSLSRISELQVAARTSSFYFKGEHADLATIAHKLNVASVLEGSVRRSGTTIRVTAQLNNAVTGYHLWSQTYDRDVSDVLKLQTDIAGAVAGALELTLLGDLAAKIEVGGTRNPAAFDAYLHASEAYWAGQGERDLRASIASYTEAIRLDPQYALAYAGRSLALTDFVFAGYAAKESTLHDYVTEAQADARKAIALAPDLAEGHLALGGLFETSLVLDATAQEFERAVALAPGNARVLSNYGRFASQMGQREAGLAATHRSVVLDPLNYWYRIWFGMSLYFARLYSEAISAFTDAKALAPSNAFLNGWANALVGLAYYHLGDFQSALAACKTAAGTRKDLCLAITYHKLGRDSEAQSELAKLHASMGDACAVLCAMVYAQWGLTSRALDSLETATRNHLPELELVKMSTLLDPLRKEPRFQAIERALKFPRTE